MQPHSFHIPVMGLGYTIDTPLKVARFGISSVVSIIEDDLVENMREVYCRKEQEEYIRIPGTDPDHRAKRITAYLDLLDRIVKKQVERMQNMSFDEENDLVKYFELLGNASPLREIYASMRRETNLPARVIMQRFLREQIRPGDIDVNIMTKLDRPAYDKNDALLPPEYSDALAALRGFAKSGLSSSIVFSAGLNPRLYSYCETFPDFFPGATGDPRKKIVLKVSDYRSAHVQGKFLAKKGLLISEFRIESGLNCGGHAFATEGHLLGPVLHEFRQKRAALAAELFQVCQAALLEKGRPQYVEAPHLKITVQGGIGTTNEDRFLLENYGIDGTGWGSPFLLVPEVTNVDDETLQQLATAKKEDYFLSYASPLGVPFNNFRKSSSEAQRKARILANRPGSPCYKEYLAFDTEFTAKPICTASRQYQNLKIKQLDTLHLDPVQHEKALEQITAKDCLCEGLGAAALIKNGATDKLKLKAVTICPGPNLAYFSGVFSLKEMIDHIYGRTVLTNNLPRPHMFVSELQMNVDFLKKELTSAQELAQPKQERRLSDFRENLLKGIEYYKALLPSMKIETENFRNNMNAAFDAIRESLLSLCAEPVVK